jgi:spore germination protein KA
MVEYLQSSEDYYNFSYAATVMRLVRFLAMFLSLYAPALYIAFETSSVDMIPTKILISLAESRDGVAFPAIVEVVIMLILFELLNESGLRIPSPIGSSLSVVGSLILGEAAVNAGIVSAPLVIIVAATAVSSLILYPLMEFLLVGRFFLLFLSFFSGLIGIGCGTVVLLAHVLSLTSFGVPYLSPISPKGSGILLDTFLKFPVFMMKKRPDSIAKENVIRQSGRSRLFP